VVARGEVCWLELAEEARRPVCGLTRDEAIPKLRNIVAALITRTIRSIKGPRFTMAAKGTFKGTKRPFRA
jgi:mRNA-degrading endonuclease toxin of MazEF toxin-antitoxin module